MPPLKLKPFKHASSFRRIAAVAWDAPRDPTIYGSMEVRADRLLEWIDLRRRETGERITITHAVARAVALAIAKHPDMNAIVNWRGIRLRQDVDVFLQVALPKEGGSEGQVDLSGTCVRGADQKDIVGIAQEVQASVDKLRAGKDADFERTKKQAGFPAFIFRKVLNFVQFLQYELGISTRWLGAPDDPFGSAMVTSLGMFGVKVAYAPFFPPARTPIIVLVGAAEDTPVAEDGAVVVRKVLTLNATFDHRIVDGYHGALISREVKRLLEYPRLLELGGARDHMMGDADDTTDLETLELNPPTQDLS
ncbi:MAG: 2-oxo acid dehydrogenase subunit E2 [Myxococcota bacterium]|nr:2-oxo acid dehydrogenase subunit E2 [Myxococcota bacterium]